MADGSIMPTIMTTHIMKTSSRSMVPHCVMRGMIAMLTPTSICSMPQPMYRR